ncbi:BID domain-containing T4SS effector [Bartonella sp. B41]
MTFVYVGARKYGFWICVTFVFEISDLTKNPSLIERKFINQMRRNLTNQNNINRYLVMDVEGGVTYNGIYKGASSDSFMVDVFHGYVVGSPDHLSPEQLKNFKIGERVVFTARTLQEFRNILIPAEKINPLMKEEIVELLRGDARVQTCRAQVCKLSKIVFGHSNKLDEKMDMMDMEPSFGDRFSNQIKRYPTSISPLAGVNLLFLKSRARINSEANISLLSAAVTNYASVVTHVRAEFLNEHKKEQQRKSQFVKLPSQDLRDLFSLPPAEQKDVLFHYPEIRKELNSFVQKLNNRLSLEEKKAVQDNDYKTLAESIGISGGKAMEVIGIVQQAKEAYRFSQTIRVVCSKEMSMVSQRGLGRASSF